MSGKAPTAERPTGDSIAKKIHENPDHFKADLTGVAHDLTDAHAHRPGAWQHDLSKVNSELHKDGILPGLDIVGVRGQDLVTRDKDGKTKLVDATDPTRSREDAAGSKDVNGRKADINPDGSGTVTAKAGDNAWSMSKDILKSQGNDNPTNNQIANYSKELEKLNHNEFKHLKPGTDIKLPPSVSKPGSDSTEFAGDRIESKNTKEQADLQKQHDDYDATRSKFAGASSRLMSTIPPSLSKSDIDYALNPANKMDVTPEDKKNLESMRANFDKLKTPGGILTLGEDKIFASSLNDWQEHQKGEIEKRRTLAYRDAKE